MSAGQVARVYATALFEAAEQAGTLQTTGGDLQAFAGALADVPALARALFDPQIRPAAKRSVLNELTRDADPLAGNTLAILLEKGRLTALPEVVTEFERMVSEAERVVDLELTTAVDIDEQTRGRIVSGVERAMGRTARVRDSVDPSIIGGLVLRVGDVIVDGSVRGRIRQLHKRLQLADVRGGE